MLHLKLKSTSGSPVEVCQYCVGGSDDEDAFPDMQFRRLRFQENRENLVNLCWYAGEVDASVSVCLM